MIQKISFFLFFLCFYTTMLLFLVFITWIGGFIFHYDVNSIYTNQCGPIGICLPEETALYWLLKSKYVALLAIPVVITIAGLWKIETRR